MNIPQIPSDRNDRTRWLRIAAGVWLLLVSALAIVNGVGLSRLTEQTPLQCPGRPCAGTCHSRR